MEQRRVQLPKVVFLRNRRGGVLFRFYTRSALTFVSFCCKPSAISPSAARIARARRGDSICAVGPPNGVGWEIWIFAKDMGTALEPMAPTPSTLWRLGESSFFEVSDTGPRGHLGHLDEIYRPVWDFGVLDTQHLVR